MRPCYLNRLQQKTQGFAFVYQMNSDGDVCTVIRRGPGVRCKAETAGVLLLVLR